MSDSWRSEATRRFPHFAEDIRDAETPYQLWTDLLLHFENAYDRGDVSTISAIYAFARWCASQPRGSTAADDLPTCVNACFVEHIPTHPKAFADMPHWFTLTEVKALRETLSYHLGSEGFERLLRLYDA